MLVFVIACIVFLVAIAAFVIRAMKNKSNPDNHISAVVPVVLLAISFILAGTQCLYAQDIGEAVVLKNFGGSLAGYTTEAGFHAKAPWQEATNWDIRNRLINFYRDSEYKYDNGSYSGATVTINDSSGTKADCDVQVIYSINPDTVTELYAEYGTQEAYVSSYVSNDVRQTTRDCAGQFTTIQLLTDKETFATAIQTALGERWADSGVVVESVSVQDIRYADSITEAYANAQTSEIDKQRAQNEQEVAKVEAETKAVEAEGERKANEILTQSLTDEVLTQEYIKALKNAKNLYIVPDGSTPMISVQ